jgi:hypothetical protein
MAFQLSTGMRNHMLVTGSVKSGLDGGVIRIYAGSPPVNADASVGSATLLCTISNNDLGTGITLAASASGGIGQKTVTETWSGTVTTSGTASFFRFSPVGDDGASTTTVLRLQGTVGTALADLLLATTAFTSGSLRQIDTFHVAMPAG